VRSATSPQPISSTRITLSRPSRLRTARNSSDHLDAMPHQITINPSGHSFVCPDGDTVLAAAMAADLILPYGCRNGACGTCKGKKGRSNCTSDAHRRRKEAGTASSAAPSR
jgi:ferredoxin